MDKKAFDMEYMTEWKAEYEFLKNHGIKPCFVKKTPDYKILQYKYTKTSELFKVLFEFYQQKELNKMFDSMLSYLNFLFVLFFRYMI